MHACHEIRNISLKIFSGKNGVFYLFSTFLFYSHTELMFPSLSFLPTVCQTCPKDWIQFQESCYFFFNLNSPWKTWDESRQFCQSNKSDLVVISSHEEQVCYKMLN
uniref:C-type lectin domain-containing protein n=1 Tax=Oryzias sinensis TaxID=183150 RepID=A0A8C7Y8T5_9TELE